MGHEANLRSSLRVVSNRGRIPYGRRVRDGVPLPGRSPTAVLSQLAYRVFGPLHPDRVRVVLDYHGLDGQPAGRLAEIAARQHVTSRTVSNRVAAVRAAGARLPLTDELIGQVTRASTPGDDHRARVRIAGALGLPAPAAPPRQAPATSSASPMTPAQLRAARSPWTPCSPRSPGPAGSAPAPAPALTPS